MGRGVFGGIVSLGVGGLGEGLGRNGYCRGL